MFATNTAVHGAGLAAPQIGVDLAVFVYDCHDATGRRQQGLVCNPDTVAGTPRVVAVDDERSCR
jgi:peptide deformylase